MGFNSGFKGLMLCEQYMRLMIYLQKLYFH